jgi:hypothetical protein
MGILTRLLGRAQSEAATPFENECLHGVLTPHWSNACDIGKEHRIARYRCQSCRQDFAPDDACWLWWRAIDRLRDMEDRLSEN